MVTMEKRFGVFVTFVLLMSILSISVLAARLPTVNGDNDGWGTVLNDYLQIAHDSSGQIKSGYISSAMITDLTIAAIDISSGAINTTHLGTGLVLNASSIAVSNAGVLNSTTNATNMNANVTGIYFGSVWVDAGSVAASSCLLLNVTMTGLPVNASCIPISDPTFGATGATLTNLTLVPANSMVVGTCGVKVCNMGISAAVDPPLMNYRVIAFTFTGN